MFFVTGLEKKEEVCYYGGVASVRLITDHGVTVHYNYLLFFLLYIYIYIYQKWELVKSVVCCQFNND